MLSELVVERLVAQQLTSYLMLWSFVECFDGTAGGIPHQSFHCSTCATSKVKRSNVKVTSEIVNIIIGFSVYLCNMDTVQPNTEIILGPVLRKSAAEMSVFFEIKRFMFEL